MSDKKWYSEEDIVLAKDALSELPDLSKKRLTKTDVLHCVTRLSSCQRKKVIASRIYGMRFLRLVSQPA